MISRRTFLRISAVSLALGIVVVIPRVLRPRTDPERSVPGSLDLMGLIHRNQWGAVDPDLENSNERLYHPITNPNGWMVYPGPLDEVLNTVIVHHSALPLTDGPREIQELHMHERRFADIGYHFLIDESGKLYEGRAINVRGAHTAGHNSGAIGVMLMGNFEKIEPTAEQIDRLIIVLISLNKLYGIENVAGHRDYNPDMTLCPGNHLAALLPDIAIRAGIHYGI